MTHTRCLTALAPVEWNDQKNRLGTYLVQGAADGQPPSAGTTTHEGEHTMKTTKTKTIKELFVKDLARVQGGQGSTETCEPPKPMPPNTTLACCEEANDGCCYAE